MQFNGKVELLQDWTTDRSQVTHVLDTKLLSGKRAAFSPAIAAAVDQFRTQPVGCRHLVLITDGVETAKEIVSDDLDPLAEKLCAYADRADVNLIVTTGGTGFGPRDNTPEATRRVIEREAPGLAEAMRMETLKHTPMAMISRGVCGIRSGTLIANLPGSPKAVRESFEIIKPVLFHAIALLEGKSHTHAQ